MADLSNNSFIPKRGPVKRSRKTASRQVYVFTFISYILMFSTLIATAGVFLYSRYVDGQLQQEITALNTEIGSFNENDMEQLKQFDLRLEQAHNRLDKTVSVTSLFDVLEAATINTVQIDNLNLERIEDEGFMLSAFIQTESFDSSLFQRGVYERNQLIDTVEFTNLQISDLSTSLSTADAGADSLVSFSASLGFALDSIPYIPVAPRLSAPVITAPDVLAPETEAGVEADDNQISDI